MIDFIDFLDFTLISIFAIIVIKIMGGFNQKPPHPWIRPCAMLCYALVGYLGMPARSVRARCKVEPPYAVCLERMHACVGERKRTEICKYHSDVVLCKYLMSVCVCVFVLRSVVCAHIQLN